MYEFHKHKYLYIKIFSLATVKSCVIVGHFGRCQMYHLCARHGLVLRLSVWDTFQVTMSTPIHVNQRMD